MTRRNKFNKEPPSRTIYTVLNSRCPICLELHNKSKKFGTPYHLLYHLNDHDSDDEHSTSITITEIKETVKQICKAIQWRMLFV